MKYIAATLICVGFIVAVCDAYCFGQPPQRLKFGSKYLNGCVYEGKLYDFGSDWTTEKCETCSCRTNGAVSCCAKLGLHMDFDRTRCEYIEDMKTCTWKLVSKEDPTKEC